MNVDCLWPWHEILTDPVYQLFLVHKCTCSCSAGGSLQVMSFIFSSSRTYFSPSSHLLLIRMVRFLTRPIWLMDWDPHTEGRSSAPPPPPPPPQFNISVFCHMQSNRVVDGPAADDKIPDPQWRLVPLVTMCQDPPKVNGRWLSYWFDVSITVPIYNTFVSSCTTKY